MWGFLNAETLVTMKDSRDTRLKAQSYVNPVVVTTEVTMKDSRDTRLKVISIMDFRWCTVGYKEGF